MLKLSRASKLHRSGLFSAAPTPVQDNLTSFLAARSAAWASERSDYSPNGDAKLRAIAAQRLPEALCETPLPLPGVDKVFASQWVNESQVVIGTKCNRLLLINVNSGRVHELPYLAILAPEHAAAAGDLRANAASPLLRPRAPTPLSAAAGGRPAVRVHESAMACVGIHSIAINPSRTRMAVGSGKPYEVVVYSMPEMVPVALMSGHSDLVFSLTFVSDDVLVTGSRDSTVGVFSLRSEPASTVTTPLGALPLLYPLAVRAEHTGKVRDLRYNPHTRQLATLGTDATVRLWDVSRMTVTTKTHLVYGHETVCLGLDATRSLLSVGSQTHVSLLDTRTAASGGGAPKFGGSGSSRAVHHFPSNDEGWGVRSLAHNEHTVACGGGMGRLSFYDIRGMRYIPVSGGNGLDEDEERAYFQASLPGAITPEAARVSHVALGICSALYTLSFNEDHTRLFAGGGPLQLGMHGAYSAIW